MNESCSDCDTPPLLPAIIAIMMGTAFSQDITSSGFQQISNEENDGAISLNASMEKTDFLSRKPV